MNTAIHVQDSRFAWPLKSGRQPFGIAIRDFSVARGERVLLVGPSGSGKSTLLSLLSGTIVAAEGRVAVLDQDLGRLSSRRQDRFRDEHLGIVFQIFNLLPYATVLDNVLLPLKFAPLRRTRVQRISAQNTEARRLLRALGLQEDLDTAAANTLSVGQQQRVAAARAFIGAPEIVLADEPTSALDADRQRDFLDLLFSEARRSWTSVLVVSHDRALAPLFDRTVELAEIARPLRADGRKAA